MYNDRPPGPIEHTKAVLSWVGFAAGVLAVSVEVFLHRSRTFGERYLGLQAAAVMLVVLFYGACWEGHDVSPLLVFLLAYLMMCLFVRIGGMIERRRTGVWEHSHYNGFPRILRLMPWLGEHRAKLYVEPMLVFLVGVFTMPLNEPLGGYLIVASMGLLLSVNLTVGYERTRAMDMNDAAIEQRDLAERFRERRGNRQ